MFLRESFPTIHTFDMIRIIPHTLVLCDIDNTILYTNEDQENSELVYNRLISHYLPLVRFDMKKATKCANREYSARYPMLPTDPNGFERMIRKIRETEGCDFLFLTARKPDTWQHTEKHLREIGLMTEEYIVHFSDTVPKGEYANRYINMNSYRRVVFIDDLRENLENMRMYSGHANMELYRFEVQK